MNKHFLILLAVIFYISLYLPANAQVSMRANTNNYDPFFEEEFINFSHSLDTLAERMRQTHIASEQAARNQYLANILAEQDTIKASQIAYKNTQEVMINSKDPNLNQESGLLTGNFSIVTVSSNAHPISIAYSRVPNASRGARHR